MAGFRSDRRAVRRAADQRPGVGLTKAGLSHTGTLAVVSVTDEIITAKDHSAEKSRFVRRLDLANVPANPPHLRGPSNRGGETYGKGGVSSIIRASSATGTSAKSAMDSNDARGVGLRTRSEAAKARAAAARVPDAEAAARRPWRNPVDRRSTFKFDRGRRKAAIL